MYSNPGTRETIGRVNRLISSWPSDDTLPAEGFDGVKPVYKKLLSGLQEVKSNAEEEARYAGNGSSTLDNAHRPSRAIEKTMEHLGVLIALRKAESPVIGKQGTNKEGPS
jgi:SAGA-associated factor 29